MRNDSVLTTDDSASQKERIALIKIALMNKVGKDALKHYDLGPEEKEPSNTIRASPGSDRAQTEATGEEGLHL